MPFLLLLFLGLLHAGCGQAPTPIAPSAPPFAWVRAKAPQKNSAQLLVDTLFLQTKQGYYGRIDELLIIQNDSILWEQKFSHDMLKSATEKQEKWVVEVAVVPTLAQFICTIITTLNTILIT